MTPTPLPSHLIPPSVHPDQHGPVTVTGYYTHTHTHTHCMQSLKTQGKLRISAALSNTNARFPMKTTLFDD